MKLGKAIFLSDESACSLFCLEDSIRSFPALFDRRKQRNARLAYCLIFAAVSSVCLLSKFFAEKMFVGVYASLMCYTRTLLHSCFQLQVIYRLGVSFAVFHCILTGNALRTSRSSIAFNDLLWAPKLLLLLGLFVLSLFLPNSIFSALSAACKYISVLAHFALIVVLNDAIFFWLNKRRFAAGPGAAFRPGRTALAYALGLLALGGGLALFAFCFIWYARVCPQYIVINAVLLGAAGLVLLLTLVKYRLRQEASAACVMFLIFAAMSWGTLAATPYSACISRANVDLLYSAIAAGVEAGLHALLALLCLLFLATANAQDVALTMSLHGPWLYDLVLIDRGSRRRRPRRREQSRELLLGRGEAALSAADEGLSHKRPRNDFYFHLLLALFGFYLAMMCTNWTSLLGFSFVADDIVDNQSLWMRFCATLAGQVYVLVFVIANLGLREKY